MAGYYPEEIVDEIKAKNDIVSVIGEYVKLQKKGRGYMGLCPFHKEKTPSFSVVEDDQYFHCFGCGKGGNVFQFIMYSENLDYSEALKWLAEKAGVAIPESGEENDREKALLRKELIEINTKAARYFYNCLYDAKNQIAMEYLENRKISPAIMRKFGLGYSTESWDGLLKNLTDEGHSLETIEKSGLIIRNKNKGYFDRFRNRVMYPIIDLRGNVIAFGGRVIDTSMPKYMNSPETPVYQKSKTLYGLNFARKIELKNIVLVEGYMDVISLHQNGIINSTASLGTALTEQHCRILKKYSDEVIIAYDSDAAGQTATLKGLDLLDSIGCSVRVLQIPEGKDPDDYMKKNGESAFRKLMADALPLFEYKVKLMKLKTDFDKTDDKIRFLDEVAVLLSRITNFVERETYAKKIARDYDITEDSLRKEADRRIKTSRDLRKVIGTPETYRSQSKNETTDDGSGARLKYLERLAICMVAQNNDVLSEIRTSFTPGDFTDELNKSLVQYIINAVGNKQEITISGLLGKLEEKEASEFTTIVSRDCNCDNALKAINDVFMRIDAINAERRKGEILQLLSEYEGDDEKTEEKASLEKELQDLIMNKKMRGIKR